MKIRDHIVKIFVCLFVIMVAATPAFAAETNVNVKLTHVDIKDITKEEQKSIVKENPKEKIEEDNYTFKLVYTKDKETGILPQMGILNPTDVVMIVGLIAVAGGIFVVARCKKTSNTSMFILGLVLVGTTLIGGTQTFAKEATLKEDITKSVEKGTVFEYTPEKIKGYTYYGYVKIKNDNTVPPVVTEKGTVKINFKNEQGKEILPSKTIQGEVGKEYTIPKTLIEGYTFKKVDGELKGKYKSKMQEVTLIYAKKEAELAKVLVKYVDTEGNKVSEPVELKGKIGDAITVDTKTIEGYKFKERKGNADTVFKAENADIILVYEKTISKLVINFIDADTNLPKKTMDLNMFDETPQDRSNYYYKMVNPFNNQVVKMAQNITVAPIIVNSWDGDKTKLPNEIPVKIYYTDGTGEHEPVLPGGNKGYLGNRAEGLAGFTDFKGTIKLDSLKYDDATESYTVNYVLTYIPILATW